MSPSVLVQYVGFEAKTQAREYSFVVRESDTDPREFTLTILNEAFDAHRVRYQDAPGICSLRLHRELAAHDNHPLEEQFWISETELTEYRDAHPSKMQSLPVRRAQEF